MENGNPRTKLLKTIAGVLTGILIPLTTISSGKNKLAMAAIGVNKMASANIHAPSFFFLIALMITRMISTTETRKRIATAT